jgi:hypothetical protein
VLEDAPTARRNLALAVDPRDGRGLLAAFQGDPGERDGFEVFAQPLLDGIPLDDRKLNEVAHDGDLHERMGAAASGGRAYVVWADAGLEAQPLLAANLTWGA